MIRFRIPPKILVLLFLLLVIQNTRAQDEKLKAIFVYNFTKYINWPEISENFVITVMGSSSIIAELKSIAMKKMVGNSPIVISIINSPAELTNCNILYLTSTKNSYLPQLFELAKSKNILIISEKKDACSLGAGINFIDAAGKVGFELSKSNLEKCGLSVSTDLLRLGKVL
jgi:hypothetical protein